MSLISPANPASPVSPLNPSNPASPMNPTKLISKNDAAPEVGEKLIESVASESLMSVSMFIWAVIVGLLLVAFVVTYLKYRSEQPIEYKNEDGSTTIITPSRTEVVYPEGTPWWQKLDIF